MGRDGHLRTESAMLLAVWMKLSFVSCAIGYFVDFELHCVSVVIFFVLSFCSSCFFFFWFEVGVTCRGCLVWDNNGGMLTWISVARVSKFVGPCGTTCFCL